MTELPRPPAPGDRPGWIGAEEPLVTDRDAIELRDALNKFLGGQWDDGQWTAFRLRYGIYGQLQPGVQMFRLKVPGGIVSFDQARGVAEVARKFAKGDVHVTTRQDFQIYHVKTEEVADAYDLMSRLDVTGREGCGNTLRNFTSCSLSGVCPREHVDAGQVAEQLAHSWIRNPLVQNMPRKFKLTVSGCATDCGAVGIHDLGLIATEKNGRKGFRVFAGGGTGGQPVAAVEVLDFVTEDALPTALEAGVRLHQRYSNRVNRNKARIKFLVKRFGPEKFRALFQEEFERLRALPQRPWKKLAWRQPEDAPAPSSPGGVFDQHNGATGVMVTPPLGLLTPDQLEQLADIAESRGATELRTTREQNIAVIGLADDKVAETVFAIRAIGLQVQERAGDDVDLVSCPGTTTCRIGITNSQDFGRELIETVRKYTEDPAARRDLRVRISGCQNGCGLHHVGDFGFRGMGKKLDGINAPHYQIYIGGDEREVGAIGLSGPIVPARQARLALELLLEGYSRDKQPDETVRSWAERVGRDGIDAYLKPLETEGAEGDRFVDWGKSEEFTTPANNKAECATAISDDALYQDLSDDGLITLDRALLAGRIDLGLEAGRGAILYGARRLVNYLGQPTTDEDTAAQVYAWVRQSFFDQTDVVEAFEAVVEAADTAEANRNGSVDKFRERLAVYLDVVEATVTKAPENGGLVQLGALEDGAGSLAAILAKQGT